jgi:hypothetical protein
MNMNRFRERTLRTYVTKERAVFVSVYRVYRRSADNFLMCILYMKCSELYKGDDLRLIICVICGGFR